MRIHRSLMIGMLALLFVSLLTAGCGKKETSGQADGSTPTAEANPVTITFWHHYSTASPEEKTLKEVLIPKFEAENPGIKVNAVAFPWDQLHKKIQLAGNVGEFPDLARLDIIWVPEFQKAGLLLPLDQEFDDFAEVSGTLLAGPLSTGKIGEHYYGLPLNTNTKVLFWNESLFAKAGINAAPETSEQFFEVLDKLKAADENIWGYGEPALRGWNILPWIWSNGGDVLSPNFDTANGYLNSDAVVEIIQKLRDAYKSGKLKGFMPGDVPVTEGFVQGTYGMMAEGPWAFAQISQQFPSFKPKTAPFPKGSAGSIQVLGGENLGLFKGKNKEEAWKFAKFLTSEFAQVEMGKAGQIPVNTKAMEHPDIRVIEYFAPFLEQLKTAKARPPVPQWPQIDEVLNDAMAEIFQSDHDVKAVLDKAAQTIDDLLKQ